MGVKSPDKHLLEKLLTEVQFSSSRSSGPGGQHVNKVNTKVELKFNISESIVLSTEQKEILLVKLKKKITNDGFLIIVSRNDRSQLKNKESCVEKFLELVETTLTPEKERKATKPSVASKIKRLENKRNTSLRKEQRKPPEIE